MSESHMSLPPAGTNYKVLFNVAFGCEMDGVAVTDEVILNASAFVPLPIGGNSATPQVTFLLLLA